MKDGYYKVSKGDELVFFETIINGRTSDNWYAEELISMGYKLELIPQEKTVFDDGDDAGNEGRDG